MSPDPRIWIRIQDYEFGFKGVFRGGGIKGVVSPRFFLNNLDEKCVQLDLTNHRIGLKYLSTALLTSQYRSNHTYG